jgi:hypothetical protein
MRPDQLQHAGIQIAEKVELRRVLLTKLRSYYISKNVYRAVVLLLADCGSGIDRYFTSKEALENADFSAKIEKAWISRHHPAGPEGLGTRWFTQRLPERSQLADNEAEDKTWRWWKSISKHHQRMREKLVADMPSVKRYTAWWTSRNNCVLCWQFHEMQKWPTTVSLWSAFVSIDRPPGDACATALLWSGKSPSPMEELPTMCPRCGSTSTDRQTYACAFASNGKFNPHVYQEHVYQESPNGPSRTKFGAKKDGFQCKTCGYFAMLGAERSIVNSIATLKTTTFTVSGAAPTITQEWRETAWVETTHETQKCNGTYRYHRMRGHKPLFRNEHGAIIYSISAEAWGIRPTDQPRKEPAYFKSNVWSGNLFGMWSSNNPEELSHAFARGDLSVCSWAGESSAVVQGSPLPPLAGARAGESSAV